MPFAIVRVVYGSAVRIGYPDEMPGRVVLELGLSTRRIRNSLQFCASISQGSDKARRIGRGNQAIVRVIAITRCVAVSIYDRSLMTLSIEVYSRAVFERARITTIGILD